MKTVSRKDLSTIHMVEGGENEHPRVILDGHVMNWVGFGWVDEGKATDDDKQNYPTVEN